MKKWIRQAFERYRQHRRTRETYEALLELDSRTLRDMGFDRSDAMSVALEITAQVDRTRVRARPAAAGLAGSSAYCSASGCVAR